MIRRKGLQGLSTARDRDRPIPLAGRPGLPPGRRRCAPFGLAVHLHDPAPASHAWHIGARTAHTVTANQSCPGATDRLRSRLSIWRSGRRIDTRLILCLAPSKLSRKHFAYCQYFRTNRDPACRPARSAVAAPGTARPTFPPTGRRIYLCVAYSRPRHSVGSSRAARLTAAVPANAPMAIARSVHPSIERHDNSIGTSYR